jgi:hypothetical protein
MRKIKNIFLAIVSVGFFIFLTHTVWAGGLVINEFVSDPETGNEWVEFYNNSSEMINLTGWWVCDNRCTATTTNSCKSLGGEVLSGGWFLFNLNTASYLNNGGDSVVLKNSTGNVDKIDYSGNFLAASKGESVARLVDGVDTDSISDWAITTILTPGSANQFPAIDEPEDPESEEPTTIPEIDWTQIKINEFVADPETGEEWVELYNLSTTTIDLTGIFICDNRPNACQTISGSIVGNGFFVFSCGASYLNNGGDSVVLRNSTGEEIDRVDYEDNLSADKSQSVARLTDGMDTNDNSDWAITTVITPGATNIIIKPSTGSSGGNSSSHYSAPSNQVISEIILSETTSTFYGRIILNEIFPNPAEDEVAEEFIEIKNVSGQEISLTDWVLADKTSRYILSGVLEIDEIKFFKRTETGIALNNSNEELSLYDNLGNRVDKIFYETASEETVLARRGDGEWSWSEEPTPGQENIFIEVDGVKILWKISSVESVSTDKLVELNTVGSLDPRGGKLSFAWAVEDKIFFGEKLSYVFFIPGKYEIKVFATSTVGTVGETNFEILVGKNITENNTGVILSEVFINPTSGQEQEFIELYNASLTEVDIAGWRLRHIGNADYIFPTHTIIESQGFLVFYRLVTKFNLNNTEDEIELLDKDLGVLDKIFWDKGVKNQSLSFFGGQWQWTEVFTPAEPNILLITEIETAVAKAIKKVAAKKITTAKSTVAMNVRLADARMLNKGDAVKVKGTVAVLPDVFGSQIFYLFDGQSGMQIYQNKKLFPDLKVGDQLEITGEISEANGRKRINVKNINDFDILSTEQKVIPQEIKILDLNENMLGSLIKISGEITEKKSGFMYVDDGEDEIAVYFKTNAKIDKTILKEGMKVAVIGVLENSSGGWQLWPRDNNDIKILSIPEESKKNTVTEIMSSDEQDKKVTMNYLLATIGGMGLILLGWLGRFKGVWVKKIWGKVFNKT